MTYASKRTFINELGNVITIKLGYKDGYVDFSIKGPESEITCNLTLQEARILKDLLEEET